MFGPDVAATAGEKVKPCDIARLEVDQSRIAALDAALKADAKKCADDDRRGALGRGIRVADRNEKRIVGIVILRQLLYPRAETPIEFSLFVLQVKLRHVMVNDDGIADGAK